MQTNKRKILFCQSDRDLAYSVGDYLTGQGFDVRVAYDGVQALNALDEAV